MRRHRELSRQAVRARLEARERGASLIIVLTLLLVTLGLGMTLLFSSGVELQSTVGQRASVEALAIAESGVEEALWRLNLRSGAEPPPDGSTVTLNSLSGFDAAIDVDPLHLRSNGADDDADGVVDEPDELNLARDWSVRIVLSPRVVSVGPPLQLTDTDRKSGPPFGSKLVLPSVQPQPWRTYSSENAADDDVLTVRFRLDVDTVLGDSEGDGPEIVFFDPTLADDGETTPNTLGAILRRDPDRASTPAPSKDSPFNLTWSDGTRIYPASGEPVLVVQSTGRSLRGGRLLARRRVEALLSRVREPLVTHALCAVAALRVGGKSEIDSYRSSQGDYGAGPIGESGHVGSNGSLTLEDKAVVRGNTEARGDIDLLGGASKVIGDAIAGGDINVSKTKGRIGGVVTEHRNPAPDPCGCDGVDVLGLTAAAAALNDNADILPDGQHPWVYGTKVPILTSSIWDGGRRLKLDGVESILLTGGTFYFDSLEVKDHASIQVGTDGDGNGLADGPPLAPVRIYVAGDVQVDGRGIVNRGRPPDLFLFTTGSEHATVRLGDAETQEFRGLLHARFASVKVMGGLTVLGAVIAREIDRQGAASVHFDEDLRNTLGARTSFSVVGWREAP